MEGSAGLVSPAAQLAHALASFSAAAFAAASSCAFFSYFTRRSSIAASSFSFVFSRMASERKPELFSAMAATRCRESN